MFSLSPVAAGGRLRAGIGGGVPTTRLAPSTPHTGSDGEEDDKTTAWTRGLHIISLGQVVYSLNCYPSNFCWIDFPTSIKTKTPNVQTF